MDGKLLYTVEEAADLLSVGRTTMFDLVRTGRVESVKINRSRRITREALSRFRDGLVAEADGRSAA